MLTLDILNLIGSREMFILVWANVASTADTEATTASGRVRISIRIRISLKMVLVSLIVSTLSSGARPK